MSEKTRYIRFADVLENDPRFRADQISVAERYRMAPGVAPHADHLMPSNLVAAYKVLGLRMDLPRMYRMVSKREAQGRKGIRTRAQAIDLVNVLSQVYGIYINYQDLL